MVRGAYGLGKGGVSRAGLGTWLPKSLHDCLPQYAVLVGVIQPQVMQHLKLFASLPKKRVADHQHISSSQTPAGVMHAVNGREAQQTATPAGGLAAVAVAEQRILHCIVRLTRLVCCCISPRVCSSCMTRKGVQLPAMMADLHCGAAKVVSRVEARSYKPC